MSKVIVSECSAYELDALKKGIQETIDALGGWSQYFVSGQKVLLKVNLIGPKRPEKAATTHPEFIRAVGQLVSEHGGIVHVGDSAGGAIAGMSPTKKSFTVSGIERVVSEEGFILVNFDEVGPVKKVIEGNVTEELYISKVFDEMDVVINLPKMKTHAMGVYTGAVKNLFGAIPGLRKAKYHKELPSPVRFGEVLADIHRAIDNMPLHIMDGVVAMQGEGPTAGSPYQAGKILVSEDPLALDRVAIELMGIDSERVEILKASVDRGIGEWELSSIEVAGDLSVLEGFKLSKRYKSNVTRNYDAVKKVVDFFKTVPAIDTTKCIHCDTCVDSCPVCAIDRETKVIDYDKCIDCLCCHELCMVEAVDLKNKNPFAGVVRSVTSVFYR